MPITQQIDSKRRLVRHTLNGTLTLAEMTRAVDEHVAIVQADPILRAGYHLLSDHRGITTAATSDQLQGLVAHISTLPRDLMPISWAIVTTSDASYGMMRMLMVLAERIPLPVAVFRDEEQALGWLSARGE